MNAYVGDLNYFPNMNLSKKFSSMKHEMVISASFQRLILSYSCDESVLRSDPNVTRINPLAYYDSESLKKIYKEKGWESKMKFERTIIMHSFDVILPPPLDPRVYHLSSSIKYEPETQTFTMVCKPFKVEGLNFFEPTTLEMCPKKGKSLKKMKTYPMFDFIVLRYQRIDEEKVLFSQTHIMDFGGWGNNQNMIKLIALSRGHNFKKNVEILMKEFPADTKIKDHKERLCREENGKCCDGFGKLIYDLDIDGKDEEWKNKNSK
jgi:hypothetical protein